MKVAYLASEYPKRTHTFIRREIAGVERHGVDVVRISIRKPRAEQLSGDEDRRELDRTVDVLDRGPRLTLDVGALALSRPRKWARAAAKALRYGLRSQRGVARHVAYFVEACAISKIAEERNVDHVHAHFGTNSAMVALLANELGGPTFSIVLHGAGEWDCPEMIHIPEKVAQARFVTAISEFAKSQTYRWSAPEHWSKVHVVRCGVDEEFLAEEPTAVPDVPRFLNIGRLGRSKAQPLIVEAAARLKEEGHALQVVIVGDGELRPHLERQISRLGLRDDVILAGWKSGAEVKEELQGSRALLLPSFAEGLPVVAMEAFALGRPVISTRVAGVPELVEEGRNGWLIPPGNLDSLVGAMRDCLETPAAKLSEMGRAGRRVVMENHDAAAEAGKLVELLLAVKG